MKVESLAATSHHRQLSSNPVKNGHTFQWNTNWLKESDHGSNESRIIGSYLTPQATEGLPHEKWAHLSMAYKLT
jgi:hypothetical protein